jgi:hypothetical protein
MDIAELLPELLRRVEAGGTAGYVRLFRVVFVVCVLFQEEEEEVFVEMAA